MEVSRNGRHIFPSHFHRNLEIFIMRRGAYDISLGEERFSLTDGTVAVIDSYEIHGYDAQKEGEVDDCVLVIPYEYLTGFTARRRRMAIDQPVIRDEALCDALLKVVDEYLLGQTSEEIRKSAVDLLLSILSQRIVWKEGKSREEGALVREILAFIQENYTGDASRGAIARALGYTEAHISRVFHRYLQKGISQYVNELRLAHIERNLARGDRRTVIELIYEAGFKSQQTYYRVKARR